MAKNVQNNEQRLEEETAFSRLAVLPGLEMIWVLNEISGRAEERDGATAELASKMPT